MPRPWAHFRPVIGSVYSSGQIALHPVSGKLAEGAVAQQAEQLFRNLEAVLTAAGKSLSDVAKTNAHLAGMSDVPVMNDIYAKPFDAPYPARTTVQAAALPLGARVERLLLDE